MLCYRRSGDLSQPFRRQNRRIFLRMLSWLGRQTVSNSGAKGIGTSGVEINSGAAFSDEKHSRANREIRRSPRPCVSPDSCTTSNRPVFFTDSAIGPMSNGCRTNGFQTSTEQPDWAAAAKRGMDHGAEGDERQIGALGVTPRPPDGLEIRRRNRSRRYGSNRAVCARKRGTDWGRRIRPAALRRFPGAWPDRAVSAPGTGTTTLRTRPSGMRRPSDRRRTAVARASAPRNRCGSTRCRRSGRVGSRLPSRNRRIGIR